MTRDTVIIVLPFAQLEHGKDHYNDYWRFTLQSLNKLFELNEMEVIYQCANNEINTSVYIMAVATKKPKKWRNKFPKDDVPEVLAHWLGEDLPVKKQGRLERLLRKFNII